jgi:prolyl-tRNA synthetase
VRCQIKREIFHLDCDLIGIPARLVVSEKTGKDKVEYKERDKRQVQMLTLREVASKLL